MAKKKHSLFHHDREADDNADVSSDEASDLRKLQNEPKNKMIVKNPNHEKFHKFNKKGSELND